MMNHEPAGCAKCPFEQLLSIPQILCVSIPVRSLNAADTCE